MPLLTRIPTHHTIRRFRTAAEHRYNEAVRLSAADDRLAAIYLAGYAAEMLLKAAYFRLVGWLPNQPIGLFDLRSARTHAITARGVIWGGHGLHDLLGWRDLLSAERLARGIRSAGHLRRGLVTRVNTLALNWGPELRYHTNRPFRAEVQSCLRAVEWIRDRYALL